MAERSTILQKLRDSDDQVRLAAARALADSARPADIQTIRKAKATEEVSWVRRALDDALSSAILLAAAEKEGSVELLGERLEQEGYSRALRDITRELAHEISPLIGAVDYFAAVEWGDYDDSMTAAAMRRLGGAVDAIRSLSLAAGMAKSTDFVMSERLGEIVDCERNDRVPIRQFGDLELIARGDPALVDLAVSNGVRNAIEATESLSGVDLNQRPIVLAWGATDIDYWVTVRDDGAGLPESRDRAFELGVTNKDDHLGMGLAIATSAASSLGGSLQLGAGDNGGTIFALRWPIEMTA